MFDCYEKMRIKYNFHFHFLVDYYNVFANVSVELEAYIAKIVEGVDFLKCNYLFKINFVNFRLKAGNLRMHTSKFATENTTRILH